MEIFLVKDRSQPCPFFNEKEMLRNSKLTRLQELSCRSPAEKNCKTLTGKNPSEKKQSITILTNKLKGRQELKQENKNAI